MISVIVPVYNVEKYLARCVDSILAQDFSDYEILLIDDGSTDSSGKICDKYEEKNSCIRTVHKQNGGLSDARNRGIEESAGEFICFIDSDDYIAKNMLSTLYRLIIDNDADIACCSAMDVFEGKEVSQVKECREFCCDQTESYKYLLRGDGLPSACNKMYRKTAISDIRFMVGKLYEDSFFTPAVLKNVKKMAVTTASLYYYFRRADSITTKPFTEKDFDELESYNICYKIVSELCPDALPCVYFRCNYAHFRLLDKMLQRDDYKTIPQYREVIKYLRKNVLRIIRDPGFGKPRKIAALALLLNVRLYKYILGMKQKIYKIQ